MAFVGAPLDHDCATLLHALAEAAGVKNVLPPSKMHVTVYYNDEMTDHIPPEDGFTFDYKASGKGIELERFGDDGDVLVLRLDIPNLVSANREFVKTFGPPPKYPNYNPHVTLSYDDTTTNINSVRLVTAVGIYTSKIRVKRINDSYS